MSVPDGTEGRNRTFAKGPECLLASTAFLGGGLLGTGGVCREMVTLSGSQIMWAPNAVRETLSVSNYSRDVSDHYPIWAEFRIDADTD